MRDALHILIEIVLAITGAVFFGSLAIGLIALALGGLALGGGLGLLGWRRRNRVGRRSPSRSAHGNTPEESPDEAT